MQLSQRTHSLDMTLSVAVKIVTFQCVCVRNRDVRRHSHAAIGSFVSYAARKVSDRCRDAPQCRLNRVSAGCAADVFCGVIQWEAPERGGSTRFTKRLLRGPRH